MINFSLLDEAYPNDNKGIKIKKAKKSEEDSCKPLQAQPYMPPLNCDNTENHKKVMENALDSNFKPSDYKKDGIKAYDYDEMDAYLNVSNIKTNNNDNSPEYRTTPFLADYLKTLRDNMNNSMSKSTDHYENIEQFTNNGTIKIDVNLYNLFLFIFLGIIIILLIDQITKLVSIHKA
jgi:hypothetical protein